MSISTYIALTSISYVHRHERTQTLEIRDGGWIVGYGSIDIILEKSLFVW